MSQSTINQGREVHGEILAATADAATRVPLYDQATNAAVTLGAAMYLALVAVAIYAKGAATTLFFDVDDLATSEDIVTANATANTFTVDGDRSV
jgi:hypothetical protein